MTKKKLCNDYRIFIPTRNSASWLGIFLDAYRDLGVEPFYIVDGRSDDNTTKLLEDKAAEFLIFTPCRDFAEAGMIEFAARNIDCDWLLRMDDDEFPSHFLLNWVKNFSDRNSAAVWSISRREVSLVNNSFVYSNWPTRKQYSNNDFILNPQRRYFNKSAVTYIEHVHTPGFFSLGDVKFAPNEAFFIHCNNILRDPRKRLAKIRIYAEYDEVEAWRVIDESLPEITDYDTHAFSTDGLEQFEDLFSKLPLASQVEGPILTADELLKARLGVYKWVSQSLVVYQNAFVSNVTLVNDWNRAGRSGLILLPKFVLVLLAEFYGTLSKFRNSPALKKTSEFLWRVKSIKD